MASSTTSQPLPIPTSDEELWNEAEAEFRKERNERIIDAVSARIQGESSSSPPEYTKRDMQYTRLLDIYIDLYTKQSKAKAVYKGIFFTVTMLCLIGLIGGSLYAVIHLVCKGNATLADVGAVLGCIAGAISALIILPQIIAKHLFPEDDAQNILIMVKNMQDNDSSIRATQKEE